jgi:hypothetical protein
LFFDKALCKNSHAENTPQRFSLIKSSFDDYGSAYRRVFEKRSGHSLGQANATV